MGITKYQPAVIEPKWQQKWQKNNPYKDDLSDQSRPKNYILVEFTYPSGDLHIGHWFTFSVPDILARFKRMKGFNVFMPNGFDAFGLPAENAAIKRNIHPQEWTLSNIERMREQFKLMGASYDWSHQIVTCLPEYYKWNQWLFIKMFEKGIAYKGNLLSNWCPQCQTVLANENVEAGKCWRCGSEVVQKEVEQWFFRITDYADRLIWDEAPSVDWPKPLRDGQNNWIGKSDGVVIKFEDLEVFTTRQDTIYGTTFIVISPEHPLLKKYIKEENKHEVDRYVSLSSKKSELDRKEEREKTGVFTGSYVKNPITGQDTPVWVADYVLMGYGTGAVMGVPAHDSRDFEFAKKYKLTTPSVIEVDGNEMNEGYEAEGTLINSGLYTGMSTSEAREKISEYIEKNNIGYRKTNYHLHDWSISRQRYWGTPIPIIYCENCGTVPVPEEDLPVELPHDVDYAPQGKPPLATAEDWVKVKCPKCGKDARREVETMDTFMDSSWYFFRYLDPKNDQEIFNPELAKQWMPVTVYFGGAEHTLGHALYSRFLTKFIHDLGLIEFDEYSLKRVHHGIILGTDGAKMSKSKGNVVNPDEQVKLYGADAVRLYLAFLGPYDIVAPWNISGINGIYHFLQRVWNLYDKVNKEANLSNEDKLKMNQTIKKVEKDITEIKFNTAIAALMEWLNHLSRKDKVSTSEYKTFLRLLASFAPHITEELWEMLGETESIHKQSFPVTDSSALEIKQVEIIVQVNGKYRQNVIVENDIVNDSEAVKNRVIESVKIASALENKEVKKVIYVPGKVINFVV